MMNVLSFTELMARVVNLLNVYAGKEEWKFDGTFLDHRSGFAVPLNLDFFGWYSFNDPERVARRLASSAREDYIMTAVRRGELYPFDPTLKLFLPPNSDWGYSMAGASFLDASPGDILWCGRGGSLAVKPERLVVRENNGIWVQVVDEDANVLTWDQTIPPVHFTIYGKENLTVDRFMRCTIDGEEVETHPRIECPICHSYVGVSSLLPHVEVDIISVTRAGGIVNYHANIQKLIDETHDYWAQRLFTKETDP
jgi:hypothetical protein